MKAVKTVAATCACGAAFQREVKRGRPQVWCPACLAIPFYERVAKPEVVIDEVADEAARIHNENDPLWHVREEIENGMFLLNAEHKALTLAAIKKYGVYSAQHLAASAAAFKAIQDLYATLAPKQYKPGRETEDV